MLTCQFHRAYSYYDSKLEIARSKATSLAQDAAAAFGTAAKEKTIAVADEMIRATDEISLGFSLFAILQNALFFLAAGRAFLVILARKLFQEDKANGGYWPMVPAGTPMSGQSDVKVQEPSMNLLLSLGPKEVLYKKSSVTTANVDVEPALPRQPLKSIVSRLRYGTYFMRRATPNNPDPDKMPTVSQDGGTYFVAVRIPRGGAVIVRWSHFSGMTSTVRIESMLSLRLPFVVLGHLRMPVLRGPGLVFLRSDGEPSVAKPNKNADVVQPYRLMCWDIDAGFRVKSSPRFLAIYADECSLDTQKGHVSIAHAGKGTWMPGVFRLFWQCIRPW